VSTLPTFPAAPPAKPRKNLWQTIAIVALFLGPVGGVLVWKVGKSTYQDYQIASAAADHFHQQLNTGDYDHIYESATDEFRRWGKREDLNRFFDNIRQKMGNAGTPSSLGFHVNWRNGVLWVDQTFNTKFEKGQAQEYFVWKIQQDQPRLYEYRIDAPNLHEDPKNQRLRGQ